MRNPNFDIPLSAVLRPEIALTLTRGLNLPTVGSLLMAWRHPMGKRRIESLFDTPEQARHAIAVCAGWLGTPCAPTAGSNMPAWWANDEGRARAA